MSSLLKRFTSYFNVDSSVVKKASEYIESVHEFFQVHQLKDLFPYEVYDEETGMYDCATHTGFIVEITPLVGSSESLENDLNFLSSEVFEEGAYVQTLLWADPDISVQSNTVFLGIKKTPQKGDTVLLDHPLFVAPLAKIIVGTEGDEVVIEHGRVSVNGEDRGEVLEKSPSSGKPLASIRSCSIPKGFVFVWAPHPHSFDSRYQEMGLIPVESIREVLWSLF